MKENKELNKNGHSYKSGFDSLMEEYKKSKCNDLDHIAEAGKKGAEAGTKCREASERLSVTMQKLTCPTPEGRKALKNVGIEEKDLPPWKLPEKDFTKREHLNYDIYEHEKDNLLYMKVHCKSSDIIANGYTNKKNKEKLQEWLIELISEKEIETKNRKVEISGEIIL